MTTTWWTGNGQNIAQVDTTTITAVANGGTVTATINGKAITYTMTALDTITTAAAAWAALLTATATTPPEFNEINWTNPSAGVVVATCATPGLPFTLTMTSGGGATLSQVHTQANVSASDPGNAANWLRAGTPGLPQAGDDVVVADSSVPILYNLGALAAVRFGSYTRWQSMTGTIGLPENNSNGYLEYRPTDFKFIGPFGGILQMVLGYGPNGSGPSRERYDVGAQQVNFLALASGSAADDYAIRFLGTSASNTFTVLTTSLGIAMLPGQTAALNTATVANGGTLALGSGVSMAGELLANAATVNLSCAPSMIDAQNGSTVTVNGTGLTYTFVTGRSGSRFTWLSGSNVGGLTLEQSSVFDKSQDDRPITIATSVLRDDTSQVLDPLSTITWSTPTVMASSVTNGPFTFGPGRTVQIT